MTDQLAVTTRRVLFAGAFILAGLAVVQWALDLGGWTIKALARYPESNLLAYATVALAFVAVLELREIRRRGGGRGPAL
jgi:hypothetical protein